MTVMHFKSQLLYDKVIQLEDNYKWQGNTISDCTRLKSVSIYTLAQVRNGILYKPSNNLQHKNYLCKSKTALAS